MEKAINNIQQLRQTALYRFLYRGHLFSLSKRYCMCIVLFFLMQIYSDIHSCQNFIFATPRNIQQPRQTDLYAFLYGGHLFSLSNRIVLWWLYQPGAWTPSRARSPKYKQEQGGFAEQYSGEFHFSTLPIAIPRNWAASLHSDLVWISVPGGQGWRE